jgi:hypothetical protein
MKEINSIYALSFEYDGEDITFYIGRSNDTERRKAEHHRNAFSPNHAEYATDKYRWIRSLCDAKVDFKLTVVVDAVTTDEDTEYEIVLDRARMNRLKGITFYEGFPLCNMRRGDLLEEMLNRPDIKTRSDIKTYREKREIAKRLEYEKANPVNEKTRDLIAHFQHTAATGRAAYEEEKRKLEAKKAKARAVLESPERAEIIRLDTLRLLQEEKDTRFR